MAYSSSPAPQYDTTLTLALPLRSVKPPAPHPRRPRSVAEGAGAPAPALALERSRVRSSLTGDSPPCTECGKRFLSWKALFGHMRCHPERQWRGITPPPRFCAHGSSASASAAAASAGRFTVQEREVAASLLWLAGARSGGGASGKGKKILPAASPTASEAGGTSASASLAPGLPEVQRLRPRGRERAVARRPQAMPLEEGLLGGGDARGRRDQRRRDARGRSARPQLAAARTAIGADDRPRRQLERHAGLEARVSSVLVALTAQYYWCTACICLV